MYTLNVENSNSLRTKKDENTGSSQFVTLPEALISETLVALCSGAGLEAWLWTSERRAAERKMGRWNDIEMELLNTNHLCPTPFVVPSLFEEPWSHPGQTHSGQAVISPANCNHSWYLHQPGFLQVLGKQSVYFPRIPTCMYNFEAGYPMLGLISLLLNQGQSSTRL